MAAVAHCLIGEPCASDAHDADRSRHLRMGQGADAHDANLIGDPCARVRQPTRLRSPRMGKATNAHDADLFGDRS